MGLENFTSGKSTTPSPSKTAQTETTNSQENNDPFKVVEDDKGREKVFKTEEDWEETKDIVEDDMGMSMDAVMSMPPGDRHQVIHQAILRLNGYDTQDFYGKKECVVCEEVFTFPANWNFTRLYGEAVCNDHEIGTVMAAVGTISSLDN